MTSENKKQLIDMVLRMKSRALRTDPQRLLAQQYGSSILESSKKDGQCMRYRGRLETSSLRSERIRRTINILYIGHGGQAS